MPARFTGLTHFANLGLSLCLCLCAMLSACAGSHRASVKPGVMPDGGTFTGVWFSPQYGEMHLIQNGATVIGRFEKEQRTGRIQGSAQGDVMRFEWNEQRELIIGRPTTTKGRGYFRVVKDDQEDTWKLIGEWGRDGDETGGGPWNAVKSKTRRPEIGGSGGEGDSSESSSSEEESDTSGGDDLGEL